MRISVRQPGKALPGTHQVKTASLKAVLSALRDHNVRYLLADGLAVNAYGFLRYTNDADIVIEMVSENIRAAFAALATLGYHPNVPITADQFAQAENRTNWVREKAMNVLQFWSDQHPETPVDLFIDVPFDFEKELAAASNKDLSDVGVVPIVSLGTLVAMKRAANRTQDQVDLDNLRLYYPTEIP